MIDLRKLNKFNFLSSCDLTSDETLYILDLAIKFKKNEFSLKLDNKVLGLIFDKSSTRTRVSF